MTRPDVAGGVLVSVGVDHRTAPLGARESLSRGIERWHESPAAQGTVVLSTCNRVEVYAWSAQPELTTGALAAALQHAARVDSEADTAPEQSLAGHVVVRTGADALRHLVRVASGLDSLVLGDEQIRGQVGAALETSLARTEVPGMLADLFSRAIEAARRVRGAADFGRHPSIAAAAVQMAQREADLRDRGAIVVGAGAMAKAATRTLLSLGARVTVCNRTPAHARRLVDRLDLGDAAGEVRVRALDALPELLDQAPAVLVGATSSRHPVVSAGLLAGRSLTVLDLGLPRDVDADVRGLPGIRLIDLDDLERLCAVDARTRHADVARVEALAAAEARLLERWLRMRQASPEIVDLRRHADAVRRAELDRVKRHLEGLTPEQQAAVDRLTRAIVQKLLHEPTVRLRERALQETG